MMEIKYSASFESYLDVKKSILFNELKEIYLDDILLKLDNAYETLNASSDEDIKKIRKELSISKDKIDNILGKIIDFLIKFK